MLKDVEQLKEEIRRMVKLRPIVWDCSRKVLSVLDQSLLPFETKYVDLLSVDDVVHAIKSMKVRGAPAIGITGAYGMVLALTSRRDVDSVDNAVEVLRRAEDLLIRSRPTAVNLEWAVKRMMSIARSCIESGECRSVKTLIDVLESEANRIFEEELDAELRMGAYGLEKISDGDAVLTQCNAGGLATGTGLGTALAPIKLAHALNMKVRVYVPETRPWLQGARLTVYELMLEGIDVVLITDTAVGYVMYKGLVDSVMVGADRILSDGHVFNKIGTFNQAVISHELGIPFYVVAPTSTIDLKRGVNDVIIEERDPDEVRTVRGIPITVKDVSVFNPVFDVTPPKYVTAIITERGIAYPPYRHSIPKLLSKCVKDQALTSTRELNVRFRRE